jgi:hypothetical protein
MTKVNKQKVKSINSGNLSKNLSTLNWVNKLRKAIAPISAFEIN